MVRESDSKNTYKDTLNLPKTGFDMRAGLLQKEPAMLAAWDAKDMYARLRDTRAGAERYILHDGPPYANGDIHMGHLLNKVLKDFVVRYKTMRGFDAPYIPGWDCHGLPIEAKVIEELGSAAASMDRMTVRQRCRQYAARYIDVQREQFRRLGGWGEWDAPYITMDRAYEADVLEVFARMVDEALVYKQLKAVQWSIENQTALAEAELEYHDREDTSVFVLFELLDGEKLAHELMGLDVVGPVSLMIWTTTPWTLPANMAVAVHPGFSYALVRHESDGKAHLAIVAEELVERVFAARPDITGREVLGAVTGRALAESGAEYAHPLQKDWTCPVVQANYVTLEDGTGLVHTAPGHGADDYNTGIRFGLEIYCPVKEDGTFDDTAPEYLRGKSVWDANELVCDRLVADGTMFHKRRFTHSYPHDWRSKKPTIFRATEQWFIAVDKPAKSGGRTLRDMAMDIPTDGSEVQFVPAWGRKRLSGMLESRPDWCISRQRSWGLPIPAFVNPDGKILLTAASVRAVANHFREKGSDCWFTDSPADLLGSYSAADDPDVENAADFDPAGLAKEMNIFDVWFESGSSWYAAAMARGLVTDEPADLYLEGSDQHRGWFQLSLLPALAAGGMCPFKTVLTHGFVVDENGRKMSKSLGNTVNVQNELKKYGTDILRLWVASVNYQDDVRTSDALISILAEAYRKIRNTLRFAMGSCFDFDPAANAVEPGEHSIDRWMQMELDRLTADVIDAYDKFEFHRVYRLIYEFCTVQASSIYMAAVKDRLYCDSPDSPRRRASQTVLHEMLLTLTRLLAPILPFTCEEAWGHIPNRPAELPESVHLAVMPEPDPDVVMAYQLRPELRDEANFNADQLQAGPGMVWQRLLSLRDDVLIKLEALRNAGVKNSLDAEVVFRVGADDEATGQLLELYLPELEDMLGVGHARVEQVEAMPEDTKIAIEVADTREKYPRCARCWKRRPDVGSDPDYPDLSARDAKAVKAIRG